MLVELASRELDDGLEGHLVHGTQREEVVEGLRLRDLDRATHADPVGQPGLLHRRPESDQVAVRFGDRGVDADEAVLRVA